MVRHLHPQPDSPQSTICAAGSTCPLPVMVMMLYLAHQFLQSAMDPAALVHEMERCFPILTSAYQWTDCPSSPDSTPQSYQSQSLMQFTGDLVPVLHLSLSHNMFTQSMWSRYIPPDCFGNVETTSGAYDL
ncbi:hypothetical protein DACRYDRAFT_23663 [Dacryopinax primogenitus]|uniref:Uncharacterized protein n=1 Tax=Dacryopinax primogenitus (strain DJM 731) TaxID=1858805 RepID=M5FVB1_DACPD|nr:uncharacterized protein DACRYDRAFT_23663 [Dacryopinax primogenitus]EJT99554.1 hypothetical protein DACRYDRAFT_23663 [Dacryopinax primogenitus]